MNKIRWECGMVRILINYGWECKMMQPLWEIVMHFLVLLDNIWHSNSTSRYLPKVNDNICPYENLYLIVSRSLIGLPRCLSGKESACSTGDEGDIGSIPGSGR